VVRVTGNFQNEAPLHPDARATLLDAIDQGWTDPRKLHQVSAKAKILKNHAVDSIAAALSLHRDEIEVIGEPLLGHQLSIGGLLKVESRFIHSAVERREVMAIARSHGYSTMIGIDHTGRLDLAAIANAGPDTNSVISLQVANGETGVIQPIEEIISMSNGALIACDYTSTGIDLPLPSRFATALFDARSWHGPAGIGILAIRDAARWRNPLPHIGVARTPQSASLPLLLAAAVALESWQNSRKSDLVSLRTLNAALRNGIAKEITDVTIAGPLDQSLPHRLSISIDGIEGEELLRELDNEGIQVDAGSACSADDIEPSHVLRAMGIATAGNIRVTLHPGVTEAEINNLIVQLKIAVAKLRD
jgi:cysteine desulfurase